MTAAWVAAGAAALALALCWPARPGLGSDGFVVGVRGRAVPERPARPGGGLVGLAVLVAVVSVLLVPGHAVVVAIASGVGLGLARLLEARRRDREAQATSGRVLETCEQVAAELSSGQPPGAALERAALDWPALAPVAAAARVGADVPGALRHEAARPGAGDLRLLAAAWQVAHRTGDGLTDALTQVAADLRASGSTRRVVRGELASARATARLVAALPVFAMLIGAGTGARPWEFLVGGPPGWICLALGAGFLLAGLAWIEAIARDVDRS